MSTREGAGAAAATAAITRRTPVRAGIDVAASAGYEPGIGRVGFVLVDLVGDPTANVVDRQDVAYAAPLPSRVNETWSRDALTPGAPYRVFFHVYDRSGVNLVAYDRLDFTA